MAKRNQKTGVVTGKIGPASTYQRLGETIIRGAHNKSYHDKKSPDQLDQRNKVSLAPTFLTTIKYFLRTSFKTVKPSDAYNQAASCLHKGAFVTIDGVQTIDCFKALVCQGLLTPPENAAVQFDPDEQSFTFTWTDNSGQAAANADDQLVFLIYNTHSDPFYSSLQSETTASRSEGTFCFKPNGLAHCEFYVYMAFRNADDTDISNSVCVGMVNT